MKFHVAAIVLVAFLKILPAQASAGRTYDSIFPYYAQYCATTQISPIGEDKGGLGGHAVLYIKGACRDQSAPHPRLAVCDEAVRDMTDPDAGVAISTDQIFKNVNWIALDGKSLLVDGGVPVDAPIDAAARKSLENKVLELGIFRGVEVHDKHKTKWSPKLSDEENIVRATFGTDYALSLGRNMYCIRMPISRAKVPLIVDELNQLNDAFVSGNQTYSWNVLKDNCTHTTHNAIAAAGVWSRLGRNEFLALQLFNLAVPANDFINLTELGNDTRLDDIASIYRNQAFRKTIMEEGTLSVKPGVLTEIIPIRQNNQLYQTDSRFLILDLPLPALKKKKYEEIQRERRYSDLAANVQSFLSKYDQAIYELERGSQTYDQVVRANPDLDFEPEFARFFVKYTQTLREMREKASLLDQSLK